MTATFTETELEQIKSLRKALNNEVPKFYDDDFCLLRWIQGWDNNHDDILPRIKTAAEVISTFPPLHHINFDSVDDVELNLRRFSKMMEYSPGGLIGFDKDGDIISCSLVGRFHSKSLLKCARVSEVTLNGIYSGILGYSYMKRQEKKSGRQLRFNIIIDLTGYNRDHLFTPGIKAYKNFIYTSQELFPEVTKTIFVINAPPLFETLFSFVKPILSQKTKEKVQILGSDYHQALFEALGQENLPKMFGGTKEYEHGHPDHGHIRMGGILPEDFKYSPLKNPLHISNDRLSKLNIPARSLREVTVTCSKPGQHLQWFFECSGDICFSIKTKDRLIRCEIKIFTEFVPEYDRIVCHQPGDYILVFDNCFSTFFSKEVRYFAAIK
ncbi:unnamed protein product [Bursaphelenchus xylophilus]|uniref:(pine wood nematode) hypothetical protein n=1 Tax=Bursaphelenchus xylophilus TaxID=6326 RepID=A0A1I7RI04_BURXY|nr:unnamed protein product [Bursaphelenchus xylophilus]CAG9115251.1 unnamed protein product [Bursaphelenchus xylophilus]